MGLGPLAAQPTPEPDAPAEDRADGCEYRSPRQLTRRDLTRGFGDRRVLLAARIGREATRMP